MRSKRLDEKIAVAVALVVVGAFFIAFLPAFRSLQRSSEPGAVMSSQTSTYELAGGSTLTITP